MPTWYGSPKPNEAAAAAVTAAILCDTIRNLTGRQKLERVFEESGRSPARGERTTPCAARHRARAAAAPEGDRGRGSVGFGGLAERAELAHDPRLVRAARAPRDPGQ